MLSFQIVRVPNPLDPEHTTIVLDFEGQGMYRVHHIVKGRGEDTRVDINFYDKVVFKIPPFRTNLNLVFVLPAPEQE